MYFAEAPLCALVPQVQDEVPSGSLREVSRPSRS